MQEEAEEEPPPGLSECQGMEEVMAENWKLQKGWMEQMVLAVAAAVGLRPTRLVLVAAAAVPAS